MLLTQEGQALLRYCQGALDLEGEALSSITRSGLDRPIFLSIAGPTSMMTSRVSEQMLPLYHEWPQLYLNLILTELKID